MGPGGSVCTNCEIYLLGQRGSEIIIWSIGIMTRDRGHDPCVDDNYEAIY